MKIKCNNCGYEWIYKGIMLYPTCPSCLKKVIIKVDKNDENKQ